MTFVMFMIIINDMTLFMSCYAKNVYRIFLSEKVYIAGFRNDFESLEYVRRYAKRYPRHKRNFRLSKGNAFCV